MDNLSAGYPELFNGHSPLNPFVAYNPNCDSTTFGIVNCVQVNAASYFIDYMFWIAVVALLVIALSALSVSVERGSPPSPGQNSVRVVSAQASDAARSLAISLAEPSPLRPQTDQDDSDKDWENAAEGGSKDAAANDQSGREVPCDADYGSEQADRQEEDPADEQKIQSRFPSPRLRVMCRSECITCPPR